LLCTSATAESLIRTSISKEQTARSEIRQRMRRQRRELGDDQQRHAAKQLAPSVITLLDGLAQQIPLRRVAGYLAFQGEIDVAMVMDDARAKGANTYVPMLDGETLRFAPWSNTIATRRNRFGIVEPDVPAQEWVLADTLDAVLVPLVAFDDNGNRLGMGGGFYDKTFSLRREQRHKPWLIGVAHSLQRQDCVHSDWWDVPLDAIVTDSSVVLNRLP